MQVDIGVRAEGQSHVDVRLRQYILILGSIPSIGASIDLDEIVLLFKFGW